VCGLVWNTHYVAYRCRTCGTSPCMSLCAECFKNGDHEGHDFNMFRSGAGGACGKLPSYLCKRCCS
jgi:E3 ubiquitin-protein ligase UBR3